MEKIDFHYGFTVVNPTLITKIHVEPTTRWQRFKWAVHEAFIFFFQCFLFALAFTCFKYAVFA